MQVTRLNIVVQLILRVLYMDQDRAPLILIGFNNIQHQVKIAETVFALGVPITVLREDHHGVQKITETIEKDFNSKILIDLAGLADHGLLKELGTRKLFSTKRRYLIVGNSLEDFQGLISDVAIHINSHLKFALINSTDIQIYSVVNPAQPFGGQFTYHLESELLLQEDGDMVMSYSNPADLLNVDWSSVTLPVGIVSLDCKNTSTVTDEFMEWYGAEVQESRDATPRLGFSMFRAFQEEIGFKYTIVCAESWSVQPTDGGQVGDLRSGAIVLGTAPMLALVARIELLDIVYPATSIKTSFIFQTPKQNNLSGSAFLKPFSWTLWLCLICAVLLMGVVLNKTILLEVETSVKEDGYEFIPSISLTVLSTFGVICQQGMDLVLKWNTSRILQVAFFFAGLVIYNYYTSLVVSDLITFPKATDVNSLRSLKDSNLELGAMNISYIHYYMKVGDQCRWLGFNAMDMIVCTSFQNSDLEHIRQLYQRMASQKKFLYTSDEGTAMAKLPGFAYHCESRITLRLMMTTYSLFELCNYHEIPFINDPIYVYADKHLPLGDFFKLQYMKTIEFGIADKKTAYYGEPKVACLSNGFIEEVNIRYIAPVLLLLVYGMVLSLVILGIEIVVDRVSK